MQPAVLLGLLGAAVVAAVGSMPVDNRSQDEEMVTSCIIEVLLSALSKSNPPPITSECRQVLKKSGKEVKDEEKSENENKKFEVRLLRDSTDSLEAHTPSSREEAGAPEEEEAQDPAKQDKKKWAQGGGHSREEAGNPQGSLYSSDSQVSKETKTHHSEKSEEEDRKEEEGEKYQKGERGEDASEKKHLGESGGTQSAFLNKRNQATVENKEARNDQHSTSRSEEETHSQEQTHSREKSSQESEEEVGRSQEKHPQESKSQPGSQEESEESEEDTTSEVAKRRLRPKHHHGRSRPDRSSQEGKPLSEERRHSLEGSEESNVGTASLEEKRDHHSNHYKTSEEEPEYGEVRNYPGVQAPEDLDGENYGGRGSEEYRAPRRHSEESQEEEDKRNHLTSELDNMAHGYSEESEEVRGYEGGKGHHSRGRGGELKAYSAPDTREEKRFLGEGYHHVQESQMDEAKRHPQSERKKQDRNYLNYGEGNGEEGAQGKWQEQEDLQDTKESRERARLQDKQYAPHHIAEKRKRLGELFNPYYGPTQRKSSHFERNDNMDDSFPEGEEENGLTSNEKNFFPEYNYDWWEKKPYAEDVNWGYENRNLARTPKLDLKRQYDRVAELDQLLHYRKKAAEFPDFYDSEEQLSTHQEAENDKDGVDQRVLTEEEEKELENLAAMDLELQKIAVKFSGNRRG
ncbi:secretogranin-1 [Elephas maximus indicus]|uniref:secretogranin-1 n=1 Tax=Elephas maximus indicus TaxID=99487 RepID=UPI002116C873|nr:secretogranin-1 [Elephas maximus indicus]